MMNNLFSIFDPASSMFIPLNWLSLFLFIILISPKMWLKSSPFQAIFMMILSSMKIEFATLMKSSKINLLLLISLFIMILLNNAPGLLSFTFTASSHLAVTLALALPLWLGFIIFSLVNNMLNFLAHLVPLGTPPVLMPFMVLIELVSNIIRPITLSVRLAANMIAGHLLLTLLGSQLASAPMTIFPSILLAQFMLMVLETAVACIQAYVFSVLTTLYASEA